MAKKVILGTDIARDAFKTKVNDNFTELYNKDVALGESINDLDALVGLGGIAESGENANGRYVRFKDGTQIAEMHVSFDTTSTNEQNYAVPASFGGVTSVAACAILGSSRVGTFDNSLAAISALNKIGGRCQQGTLSLRISEASTITNLGLGIMLLGRWK